MEDDFAGDSLDLSVWSPRYLPAWSSKAATRASYAVHDSCLEVSIPPDQGGWCVEEHHPPLRVSGSAVRELLRAGGQHGRAAATQAGTSRPEEQEPFWGWTPRFGRIDITARMSLAPRSMASLWLVGRETVPGECAEICVFEIFGDTVVDGASAAVGSGLHAFRDPEATERASDDDRDHVPQLVVDRISGPG